MKLFIFFFSRSVLVFILTFIAFSLIRTKYFRRYKRRSSGKREFYLSIFAAYLAVLSLLLFTPNAVIASHGIDLSSAYFDFVGNFKDRLSHGIWGVNIIPFKTITSYLKYSGLLHAFINIAGNIVIFIPFGVCLPTLYRKGESFLYTFRNTVFLSVFIEFIQFFIGRSVDIDDVILNTLGGVIGYFIFVKYVQKKGKISI